MLSSQQIEKLKAIPITQYLASIGHYPDKEAGKELQYYSPIRNESTPSFFVNPDKNVFHDFGGERGDVIRLVGLINKSGFVESCQKLQAWGPGELAPLSGSRQQQITSGSGGIQLIKAIPLQNNALSRYAENRRIPFLLAAKYCKEVHYTNKEQKYYALGFESDKGGYELRNNINGKDFKSCISPKGITSFLVPGSTSVSVFEGFFDFLSALVYFNVQASKNSVVVLNSTSNLNAAIETLSKYTNIYSYLDNDKGGVGALDQLKKQGLPVIDKSNIYAGYKDFSEMICRLK
ncbi:CHC2 zinc finger [Dyadobacter koreensis]|uniref:CHC2 zinc finger n=1 Tax=Dyadobacter koreensis TaxID=408657 RepID=A0A1H7B0S6_9BACT|nr:toprim domain-containing protein [Dyadobacter koreensis]SEJ71108.1 CHC2 zinc finger [Dyadobacter koreensis]